MCLCVCVYGCESVFDFVKVTSMCVYVRETVSMSVSVGVCVCACV